MDDPSLRRSLFVIVVVLVVVVVWKKEPWRDIDMKYV